jgi:hypothetical protein
MGKVIGVLLFVLGLWAATEYAAGTGPFSETQGHAEQSNAAAAGAKVSDAYEQGNARREALLAD